MLTTALVGLEACLLTVEWEVSGMDQVALMMDHPLHDEMAAAVVASCQEDLLDQLHAAA